MMARWSDSHLAGAQSFGVPRDGDIHPEFGRQPLCEDTFKSLGDVLDDSNPDSGSSSKGGQQLVHRSRPSRGRSNCDISQFTADHGDIVRFGRNSFPIP